VEDGSRKVALVSSVTSHGAPSSAVSARRQKTRSDILVPYFEASLANSQFCLRVTSEPLVERDARRVMARARSDFARYVDQLHPADI